MFRPLLKRTIDSTTAWCGVQIMLDCFAWTLLQQRELRFEWIDVIPNQAQRPLLWVIFHHWRSTYLNDREMHFLHHHLPVASEPSLTGKQIAAALLVCSRRRGKKGECTAIPGKRNRCHPTAHFDDDDDNYLLHEVGLVGSIVRSRERDLIIIWNAHKNNNNNNNNIDQVRMTNTSPSERSLLKVLLWWDELQPLALCRVRTATNEPQHATTVAPSFVRAPSSEQCSRHHAQPPVPALVKVWHLYSYSTVAIISFFPATQTTVRWPMVGGACHISQIYRAVGDRLQPSKLAEWFTTTGKKRGEDCLSQPPPVMYADPAKRFIHAYSTNVSITSQIATKCFIGSRLSVQRLLLVFA